MFKNVEMLAQELKCRYEDIIVDGRPGFLLFDPLAHIAGPRSWLWYAPTLADLHPGLLHAWMFQQFLANGMATAGIDVGESCGNPAGTVVFSAFYNKLVKEHRLSKKACLMPQSRGGLMLYNWAAEHPDDVACIVGIYVVCDMRSYPGIQVAAPTYGMKPAELESHLAEHNPIERLASLAKAKVPILHIHGDTDTTVPLERNSGELARRYQSLGGSMELIVVPGGGHIESEDYFQCPRLVDFVLKHN